MEFIRQILENAKIEDGKLDIDAVMKEINEELPKHIVPKDQYNAKVQELKAANTAIEELKKAGADNDNLQQKISDYESEIKSLKTQADNARKEYTLKEKLTRAGVIDVDYVIYKNGGLEKFSFDKEGNPVGIDEMLKPLKESSPHLFRQEQGGYTPAGGGKPPVINPWTKEAFNLTEQGRIYKEDPARARELAQAAGVKLNE